MYETSLEELKRAVLSLKYYINNPSAWDSFSQNVSNAISEVVSLVDQEVRSTRTQENCKGCDFVSFNRVDNRPCYKCSRAFPNEPLLTDYYRDSLA